MKDVFSCMTFVAAGVPLYPEYNHTALSDRMFFTNLIHEGIIVK